MHTFIKVWTQDFMAMHKVFTTKPLQDFDEMKRRLNFIICDMKLLKIFEF
jgi:hypothetical protein